MQLTPRAGAAASGDRRPVFQQVLGNRWDALGEVIRQHYFLRPFSQDAITVVGTMDEIWHSAFARLLVPGGWLVGGIVPFLGREVPVAVHYSAGANDSRICWDRVFRFAGHRRPFHFRSSMEPVREGEAIEFIRFGIGIRLRVTAEDGALVFRSSGYLWRIGGFDLPLPLGLLLGRAYVEERPAPATGPDAFTMRLELRHRWFGLLFRYSGRFRLGPASGGPHGVPA